MKKKDVTFTMENKTINSSKNDTNKQNNFSDNFQPIFRISREELDSPEDLPFSFSEFIRKNVVFVIKYNSEM